MALSFTHDNCTIVTCYRVFAVFFFIMTTLCIPIIIYATLNL